MRNLPDSESILTLVKPIAGLLALGILALAVVGIFVGIASAIISFAAWFAIRLLPILAVAALLFWIAREAGLLKHLRR